METLLCMLQAKWTPWHPQQAGLTAKVQTAIQTPAAASKAPVSKAPAAVSKAPAAAVKAQTVIAKTPAAASKLQWKSGLVTSVMVPIDHAKMLS